MRSVLLCCVLTSASFAQENGPTPPSGYSFADGQAAQISLEVRFVSGPGELFLHLRNENAPRIGVPPSEMKLAAVSDEELKQSNGIRLVSATATTETRTPVFVEKLTDGAVRQLLQAVQNHVRGNILLAPKVTLFDNQTAVVQDTTSRLFAVGLEKRGQSLEPTIRAIDDGTKMIVRCQLRPENSLRIDFRARLSSVEEVGQIEAGPPGTAIQIPMVDARDIQLAAELLVGETLAVRGIPTQVKYTTQAGVPVLDKVPYVSRLFRNTGTAVEHQELVILLTPRIVEEKLAN